MDALRSIWYSLSDSVWHGATTMLSPVHADRVEVFRAAHDDTVVRAVTHHFELEFPPSRWTLCSEGGLGGSAEFQAFCRRYTWNSSMLFTIHRRPPSVCRPDSISRLFQQATASSRSVTMVLQAPFSPILHLSP